MEEVVERETRRWVSGVWRLSCTLDVREWTGRVTGRGSRVGVGYARVRTAASASSAVGELLWYRRGRARLFSSMRSSWRGPADLRMPAVLAAEGRAEDGALGAAGAGMLSYSKGGDGEARKEEEGEEAGGRREEMG